MNPTEMKDRTKKFALRIIKLVQALPSAKTADVIGRQLLRAGTSVGANYRAACRAKSKADFVNKLRIVQEETDECIYWMELLIDAKIVRRSLLTDLMAESEQLLSIAVASINTASRNKSAQSAICNLKSAIKSHSEFRIPNF